MIEAGKLVHVRIEPWDENTFTAVILGAGPIEDEDGSQITTYHLRGQSGTINGQPAEGQTVYAHAGEVALVPF